MSSVVVRLEPACVEDAAELADIRVLAMRDSLERIGRFDPQRARDRFLGSFVPEFTRHIVSADSRVGFVVIRPIETGLLLDHLYVLPAHQGRGIGAAVLVQIFSEADAANKSIRVGALRESDSNRFYSRHGFKLVEQAEWDYYYVREACRIDAPAPFAD